MIGFIRPVEADDLSVTPFNELPHVRAEPPVRVATVDEAQASSSLPRYDDVGHTTAQRERIQRLLERHAYLLSDGPG